MKSVVQKTGWFVDFDRRIFFPGVITLAQGKVISLDQTGEGTAEYPTVSEKMPLILPGMVDAHVHIESSMVMPSRFEEMALRYGTVATVSDPHEIANVMGVEGVRLMAEDAAGGYGLVHFTAPSCVPATDLEESGAALSAADLEPLFEEKQVVALGEVMNFPGVLARDPEVMKKIELSRKYGKPVDGHAPGLSGEDLTRYVEAGIQTDHECFTLAEALEKAENGMKILIREGSAARNFDTLWPLIQIHPQSVMLCTDDFHPDDLATGHLDTLIRRGLAHGLPFFDLYRCASHNPVKHYNLPVGLLNPGDPADFVEALLEPEFRIISTWLRGECVYGKGVEPRAKTILKARNRFIDRRITPDELAIQGDSGVYRVIEAIDGELVTGSATAMLNGVDGLVTGDVDRDILKIVVVNRYRNFRPSAGWVRGFGLKRGAIASSIAHDSHNLVAVGTDDESLADVLNAVIQSKGGIAVHDGRKTELLPLPMAGLMSTLSVVETGSLYAALTRQARELGSPLRAPFMTLAFMSLLVIPHLKLGDRGLFDVDHFTFVNLKAD